MFYSLQSRRFFSLRSFKSAPLINAHPLTFFLSVKLIGSKITKNEYFDTGPDGIEPSRRESKSCALPLRYGPMVEGEPYLLYYLYKKLLAKDISSRYCLLKYKRHFFGAGFEPAFSKLKVLRVVHFTILNKLLCISLRPLSDLH